MQATVKAGTGEAGADLKESGLFSGARNLEDGELTSQSPSPHLREGRGFYKVRKNRTKRPREGLESSVCADEHSPFP